MWLHRTQVMVTHNAEDNRFVKVKIRSIRTPQIGDKVAPIQLLVASMSFFFEGIPSDI